MEITRATAAVVALENAMPDVLFDSVPGTDIMIWPLLRWPVATAAATAELGIDSVPSTSVAEKAWRALAALLPNRAASRRVRRHRDVLFVVSGTTTVPAKAGGRDNWLVQRHAEAIAPRALVVQDAPLNADTPAAERPSFEPTVTFHDAMAEAELIARFAPLSSAALGSVERSAHEILRLLDLPLAPARKAAIVRRLVIRVNRARHIERRFARLLDAVQPRLVVMQTAAYGDRSPQIALLKAAGVTVAELQHGWIGPSHAAYNYGSAAAQEPLRSRLPDVLLTFGSFWSAGLRGPFGTEVVGRPALDDARATVPALSERDRHVTVVSSVTDAEATTKFTLAVRDALPPEWSVRFRPHPIERPTVARRYPLLAAADRIRFDVDRDLYAAMRNSRAVIGEASTVLYEALAMGCPVLVRDSPIARFYADPGVFGPFVSGVKGVPDAVAGLIGSAGSVDQATLDTIWAPDSRHRFAEFAARF